MRAFLISITIVCQLAFGNGVPAFATESRTVQIAPTAIADPSLVAPGSDQTGLNFSGANFSNRDLSNVIFAGANLTGANLSGANVTGANLTNAVLTSANVSGAVFTSAVMSGVTSGSIVGTVSALPLSWSQLSGYLVGPGAVLTGANFSGASLTSRDLSGANLSYANLSSANLTGALLTNANLGHANLSSTNLTSANLSGADLSYADLTLSTQTGANFQATAFFRARAVQIVGRAGTLPPNTTLYGGIWLGPGLDLHGITIYYVNLYRLNLNNLDLHGADLSSADFTYIDMSNSNFSGANLKGLRFRDSYVQNSDFSNAIMDNSSGNNYSRIGGIFSNASLRNTRYLGEFIGTFTNADLTNCQLGGDDGSGTGYTYIAALGNSDLSSATLDNCFIKLTYGANIKLPPGWSIVAFHAVGPKADLSGESFPIGTAFNSLDLSGANLAGISCSCNFSNSNLRGANLTRTYLAGSSLLGIKSGQVIGTPGSLPTGWKILNGYLIGPGADLTNADLRNTALTYQDLTGATLTGSKLQGALLAGATLTGVVAGGITGTPSSMPTGWAVGSGYFFGPGVNLAGANLANTSLTNVNLTNAVLAGANLSNSSLTNVTISGANFGSAVLTNLATSGLAGTSSTLPTDWTQLGSYLLGPTANLGTASLVNANLTNLNLSGANLANANLTGANVQGANLASATVPCASASIVSGIPAQLPDCWIVLSGILQQYLAPVPTVSGTFATGSLLQANTGTWNQGVDLGYQWLRDGSPITGATTPTLLLSVDDYSHLISVRVTATASGYTTTARSSLAVAVGTGAMRSAPTPVLSSSPETGVQVSAIAGIWDPGVTLAYQWLRDGAEIPGATSDSYIPSVADFNHQLSARVTGSSFGFTTTSKISQTAVVVQGHFSATPTPTLSGAFVTGGILTAIAGTWDPGVSLSYQWLRNGQQISGATSNNYVLVGVDFGQQISVSVTGQKTAYLTTSKQSAAGSIGLGKLMNTPAPVLTGKTQTGQVVSVATGNWDQGVNLKYQWLRDGNAISGAVQNTYMITPQDYSHSISISVTGTSLGFSSVTLISGTYPIATGVIDGNCVVSGKARIGKAVAMSLIGAASFVSKDPSASTKIQWLFDGKPIKKATKNTLALTKAMKGHKISVSVKIAGTGYSAATFTSVSVKVG